ncbi:hypothetical protein GOP47_0012961, partial [Adiantum capillus-veneris]
MYSLVWPAPWRLSVFSQPTTPDGASSALLAHSWLPSSHMASQLDMAGSPKHAAALLLLFKRVTLARYSSRLDAPITDGPSSPSHHPPGDSSPAFCSPVETLLIVALPYISPWPLLPNAAPRLLMTSTTHQAEFLLSLAAPSFSTGSATFTP